VVGAARFALGKDEMERFPNPFTAKDLPEDVQVVIDDALATAAYSTARGDTITPDGKNAQMFLKDAGIDRARLGRLLVQKLRKQGYTDETAAAWRSRMMQRLR
jgi:hypothetical protein